MNRPCENLRSPGSTNILQLGRIWARSTMLWTTLRASAVGLILAVACGCGAAGTSRTFVTSPPAEDVKGLAKVTFNYKDDIPGRALRFEWLPTPFHAYVIDAGTGDLTRNGYLWPTYPIGGKWLTNKVESLGYTEGGQEKRIATLLDLTAELEKLKADDARVVVENADLERALAAAKASGGHVYCGRHCSIVFSAQVNGTHQSGCVTIKWDDRFPSKYGIYSKNPSQPVQVVGVAVPGESITWYRAPGTMKLRNFVCYGDTAMSGLASVADVEIQAGKEYIVTAKSGGLLDGWTYAVESK